MASNRRSIRTTWLLGRAMVALGMAASFAALGVPASHPAVAAGPLTEISFGVLGASAGEWPVYIAEAQGFFRDEGLKVNLIAGGSPTNVINELASGAVDMADDGTDSLIAAVAHGLPIRMVASQFITDPYSLVTSPNITTWAQLKGKSVILGTKQDVTALSFDKMMEAQHLTEADFSLVVGGNSGARYAALTSGNVQGALLAQPFDLLAESKGMHILASSYDVVKEWIFTCVAVNNAWGAKNRGTAVHMVRALRKAVAFGYAHPDETVKVLVDATHVDKAVAQKAYDLDFRKWHAFDQTGRVSGSSLQAVAKLMMQHGIITKIPAPGDLVDTTYLAEASK